MSDLITRLYKPAIERAALIYSQNGLERDFTGSVDHIKTASTCAKELRHAASFLFNYRAYLTNLSLGKADTAAYIATRLVRIVDEWEKADERSRGGINATITNREKRAEAMSQVASAYRNSRLPPHNRVAVLARDFEISEPTVRSYLRRSGIETVGALKKTKKR